jgi:outer membrane protein TolC
MSHPFARALVALSILLAAADAAAAQTSAPGAEGAPAEPPSPAGPAAPTEDPFAGAAALTHGDLVRAVLARNPTLEAARLAWRAATQRVPQATALMDPMVAAAVAPLSLGSEMDLGYSVEARQPLPWPGRRRLAGDVARAEAVMAGEDARALALELALTASDLYHDLYVVERSLVINRDHLGLVGELMAIATARYAAGLAPQQAPLQAEVELAHLMHREVMLVGRRDELAARLNALLHRPAGAALPPPASVAPPPGQAAPTATHHGGDHAAAAAGTAAGALAARPEVAAADAAVRAAALEGELAGLARYPDLEAMTSFSTMFGSDHRWMVGVAVDLPVYRGRIRAAEAEAAARLEAAARRREAVADAVLAEVEQAAVRLHEAEHVVELYAARILPASRDATGAARSAFESGSVDFTSVIDAERNLRDVDLSHEEALAEVGRRRAALDRALGRLPGLDEAPASPTAPDDPPDEPEAPAAAAAGGAR